jgi:hypothetical protein
MTETHTGSRTEEGITVGIIDSITTLVRLLRTRNLYLNSVDEALLDLASDSDFHFLVRKCDMISPNSNDLT